MRISDWISDVCSSDLFIFIPATFRGFDYAAMLSRAIAPLATPPGVVVLRGDAGPHLGYDAVPRPPVAAQSLPGRDADAARLVMYPPGPTGRQTASAGTRGRKRVERKSRSRRRRAH